MNFSLYFRKMFCTLINPAFSSDNCAMNFYFNKNACKTIINSIFLTVSYNIICNFIQSVILCVYVLCGQWVLGRFCDRVIFYRLDST